MMCAVNSCIHFKNMYDSNRYIFWILNLNYALLSVIHAMHSSHKVKFFNFPVFIRTMCDINTPFPPELLFPLWPGWDSWWEFSLAGIQSADCWPQASASSALALLSAKPLVYRKRNHKLTNVKPTVSACIGVFFTSLSFLRAAWAAPRSTSSCFLQSFSSVRRASRRATLSWLLSLRRFKCGERRIQNTGWDKQIQQHIKNVMCEVIV